MATVQAPHLYQTIQQDTAFLRQSFNQLKCDVKELLGDISQSLLDAKKIISQASEDSLSDNYEVKTIGTFRSCFLTKNGTPRQPSICPYARGSLTITCFNNPEHSLQSLQQFSHVWLIFLFHENGSFKPKAKISPPRLNGKKVGVFATRSPHRPNNVGMSLVKLDSIQNGTLYVSGVDLIGKKVILSGLIFYPTLNNGFIFQFSLVVCSVFMQAQ